MFAPYAYTEHPQDNVRVMLCFGLLGNKPK